MSDTDVVIVAATRTPIGNFCGGLASMKAHELGATVIKSAILQANLQNTDITEVVLGQALQGGQGQNPARQASLTAQLPVTTTAYCVNMLCGSGLKAVALAYQSVLADPRAIVVAGGQESMTQAPHFRNLRNPIKMGNAELIDSLLHDGLTDACHNIHMGQTAENVAEKYKIGREEQDAYATESQQRAEKAIKNEIFSKEISPVNVLVRGKTLVIDKDEFPRHGTTIETLSKLKPVFNKTGTVTAGNASGVNDGAAVVIVMSKAEAKARSLTPRARIVASAQAGIDPLLMGLGPVPAVQALKVGWSIDDVDLFELNEAFAVQSLAVLNLLGIDSSKVNVNGGAIALGHPIGASGARVLVTLLHALEQRNLKRGIAALCIGGGMGIALAIEI